MISYKIYPLPGMCEKTLTGSLEAKDLRTLGDLLSIITDRDGVDFAADTPFLALLDGKTLDLSKNRERIVEDGSELLILPAIMGG